MRTSAFILEGFEYESDKNVHISIIKGSLALTLRLTVWRQR